MSWIKGSDTAGQHPIVNTPMAWEPEDGDVEREDLVNLLFGMVYRCAAHSAQYDTDYVISDGTISTIAGRGWRARAAQAERAGYWTRVDSGYLLIDDSEHFVHIRLKAEKEWEKQRKRDNGNPALVIPVRLRDGDGCRYCGVVVNWAARRGGRNGTYDHRQPSTAARGPDDLVVSCGRCNSMRQDDPHALTLLPAPATPFYGELTVELLAEHGITVPLSTPARPRRQQGPAPATPSDPAPSGPPPQQPTRSRTQRDTTPATPSDPAPSGTTPQPARPAPGADTAPATRQPGGHRALRHTATPPPAGHRALRDRATGPTPRPTASDPTHGRTPPANNTIQDQQRLSAEPGGNRQIGGLPDLAVPGRDRDRAGHGSGGRAPSSPPADRRRRRGRRGRGAQPHPGLPPAHLEEP